MDRNRATATIARRVSQSFSASGADLSTLAQAADMTTSQLTDRLEGRVEFQLDELVTVGGFLRTPAQSYLEA